MSTFQGIRPMPARPTLLKPSSPYYGFSCSSSLSSPSSPAALPAVTPTGGGGDGGSGGDGLSCFYCPKSSGIRDQWVCLSTTATFTVRATSDMQLNRAKQSHWPNKLKCLGERSPFLKSIVEFKYFA
ncbi:hypothetical protein BC937DRAFT_86467, partial [Endogone sp. FLAS-F59071]